jgi:hypothetical protein
MSDKGSIRSGASGARERRGELGFNCGGHVGLDWEDEVVVGFWGWNGSSA